MAKWRDPKTAPPNKEVIVFCEEFRDTRCKGVFYGWVYKDNMPDNLNGWWCNDNLAITQGVTCWQKPPEPPEEFYRCQLTDDMFGDSNG